VSLGLRLVSESTARFDALGKRTRTPAADTITITFHDWGAPFTLHVPPARKTFDITDRVDSP
jgi:hypothetical protein